MKKRNMENFRAATAAVPRSDAPAPPTVAAPEAPSRITGPSPVARPLAQVTPRMPSTLRTSLAWYLGATALLVFAVIAVMEFSSVTRASTNWLELLGSLVVLGAGGYALTKYLRPSLQRAGYTGIVVLLLFGIFSYGLANSVILNGKVYWEGSTIARAYHLSHQLQSAIDTMQNYDVLLTYTIAQGRAHFSEYHTAIIDISQIYTYWSKYSHTGLPDPEFIDAINNVAAAANADAVTTSSGPAGAIADELTYINNSFNDTALATTIVNERASVITALTYAQAAINAINTKFHFSTTSSVHE